MKPIALTAETRSGSRRDAVKKLRHAAKVPAVMYGKGLAPQNLQLAEKEIGDTIHHAASDQIFVDLAVAGTDGTQLALIRDVQHHPLSGQILHVDFLKVAEDQKVTVTVPIEPMGEPVGVKTGGGILEHVLFFVTLRGLPADLPEVLNVDVSSLDAGDTLHLGELPLPDRVEVIGNRSLPVFSIGSTRASRAAANAEGAEAAEDK